jgi:uncharacterized protein DUF4199
MKIPIKYGLLAALGLIAWVLATHAVISNPDAPVLKFGTPIFFNVLHFIMIFLGIKAYERERGEKLPFKQALTTGVSIAVVFALTATVFFIIVVLAVGTRWMGGEPGAGTMPRWILMVQAFAGIFLGTIIFGLIYSTVIAAFVARRQTERA